MPLNMAQTLFGKLDIMFYSDIGLWQNEMDGKNTQRNFIWWVLILKSFHNIGVICI